MTRILLLITCLLPPMQQAVACAMPEKNPSYMPDPLVARLAQRNPVTKKILRFQNIGQYLAYRFDLKSPVAHVPLVLKSPQIPDNSYLVPVKISLPKGHQNLRAVEVVISVDSPLDKLHSPYVVSRFNLNTHTSSLGLRFKMYSTRGWIYVIAISNTGYAYVAASARIKLYPPCMGPVYVPTEDQARALNAGRQK